MPETGGTQTYKRQTLPQMVAFDVTTRCNLRCLHCYNDSGTAASCGDMGRDALLAVAEQIKELRPFNVCLCGGEPLCCPSLLDVLDALRPDVGRVSMVTNGYAVTEEIAKELVAHGLYAVQISLDGAYAWQHDSVRGVKGSFKRAKAAISAFRSAGVSQIMTAILPNKLNRDSLDEYVKLCVSLGVDIVRSMPFLPSGRGRSMGRPLMLNNDEYLHWRRQIRKLSDIYGGVIRVEWDDPLGLITTMPKRTAEGAINLSAEIRANGELVVSSYLPIIVGDLTRHSLLEYWRGGYDRIWADPRVTDYVSRIHNIYDFDELDPLPYGGEQIKFDILEGTR